MLKTREQVREAEKMRHFAMSALTRCAVIKFFSWPVRFSKNFCFKEIL